MQRASARLCNAESSAAAAAAAHFGGERWHLRFMVWVLIHPDMQRRGFQYVSAHDPTLEVRDYRDKPQQTGAPEVDKKLFLSEKDFLYFSTEI